MNGEIDDIIEEFVVTNEVTLSQIRKIIHNISKVVKIDKDGNVIFLDDKMSLKKKILAIIFARYLAYSINKLTKNEVIKNVDKSTSLDIIYNQLYIKGNKPEKTVRATLSSLVKQGLITRSEKGKYTIGNLTKSKEYLLGEK